MGVSQEINFVKNNRPSIKLQMINIFLLMYVNDMVMFAESPSEKWVYMYNEQLLEVLNTSNYLGMLFNFNGKFLKTPKHIAKQGKKALFAMFNTFQNKF